MWSYRDRTLFSFALLDGQLYYLPAWRALTSFVVMALPPIPQSSFFQIPTIKKIKLRLSPQVFTQGQCQEVMISIGKKV